MCDEGDGVRVAPRIIRGQTNVADDTELATAGLRKWTLQEGTWHLVYTLQDGLEIGVPYTIANYPTSLNPPTGGRRNLTGRVNGDGTVQLYAITSTISANGDQGADPNKLVTVSDRLNATSLASGNSNGWGRFATLRTAQAGEVLRGISFAPGRSATIAVVKRAGTFPLFFKNRKVPARLCLQHFPPPVLRSAILMMLAAFPSKDTQQQA